MSGLGFWSRTGREENGPLGEQLPPERVSREPDDDASVTWEGGSSGWTPRRETSLLCESRRTARRAVPTWRGIASRHSAGWHLAMDPGTLRRTNSGIDYHEKAGFHPPWCPRE